MNKFEKLIEYVINDDDGKASDLFHEIVVEKSRSIYEGLMQQDDRQNDFQDDIESDEQGRQFEADDEPMDAGDEMIGGEEEIAIEPEMGGDDEFSVDGADEEGQDLEDRVVDVENQLDELMAEFEQLVGDDMGMEPEIGDEMSMEPEMGDEMGMEPEMEESRMRFEAEEVDEDAEEVTEEDDSQDLDEALELTKVTNGIANSTEEGSVNKKSINNDNSGSKGSDAKPHQTTGDEKGRTAPTAKDMGYTPTQEAGKKAFKTNAPKPKTGEESGTNDKSLVK